MKHWTSTQCHSDKGMQEGGNGLRQCCHYEHQRGEWEGPFENPQLLMLTRGESMKEYNQPQGCVGGMAL